MWFEECPSDDQGIVRPVITESGTLVLRCDAGGEVWLEPDAIVSQEPVVPSAPEWTVHGDVHVKPGTTRWATVDELPKEWPDSRS